MERLLLYVFIVSLMVKFVKWGVLRYNRNMNLAEDVEVLTGVGPKTAEILRKYGIRTVRDFFYNLPRDYENFEAPTSISEMKPGKVVIKGRIDSLSTRRARRTRTAPTA